MKAIYSYKILDRFWKKRTDDFFKLAKLSVDSTKNIYPTVLYTDSKSKEIFDSKGIIFDDYVINEKFFADVNEHTYGLSKFAIFLNEKSPYVSLDLDTVLFENISSTDSITYGYKEVNFIAPTDYEEKQYHIEYLNKYYWKYFVLMDEEFKNRGFKHYTDTYPSNSLVLVNNPPLMRKCAQEVIDLLKKDYRKYTVQFYEQYLLAAFLRNYQSNVGYLYSSNPIIDLREKYNLPDILKFKFVHLDTYDRDENVIKLIGSLENFFSPKLT